MSTFLKIDLFRRLPRDLTEPTFCGALVSFICAVVLILLTISEVYYYLSPATRSSIGLQTDSVADVFHINIDIVMPRMPCDVVGIDLEDSMGNHIKDIKGTLLKHSIDKHQ